MPIPAVLAAISGFVSKTASKAIAAIAGESLDPISPKPTPSSLLIAPSEQPHIAADRAKTDYRLVHAQLEHQKQLATVQSEALQLIQERNTIEETRLKMEGAIAIAEAQDRQKALELQSQLVHLKQEQLKLTARWQKKQEELARLERQFSIEESALYREVLRDFKAREIDFKLAEIQTNWDTIEKNWPSRLSRRDTEEILVKGREQYPLLLFVAPPNISKSCPESFHHNLPQELRNRLKAFLNSYYPENALFPVEFYGDYFNRDIFDIDVKQLRTILSPIPTAVLYCDITDREVYFNIGVWGWQDNTFSQIPSPPWNWREEKKRLMALGEDEDECEYQVRQEIVKMYKLFAAFFADWYYINLDRNYQPQLFNLESEFPSEWVAPYVEMFQKIYRVNQAGLCYDRGLMLAELGYGEQAIAAFEKASEWQPDFPDAFIKRGKALHELGRCSEAAAALETVLENHPESDEAWYWRGRALASLGEYELAVTCFEEAIALNPNNGDSWVQLAEALSAIGRDGEAATIRQKAELLPETGEGAIAADSSQLVWVNAAPGGIEKYSPEWTVAGTLSGYSFPICALAFSPDSQLLATNCDENAIKIWSVLRGIELRYLAEHDNSVTAIAFSPDGQFLASASWDNTVKICPIAPGKPARALVGHSEAVKSVAFSPDGQLLASGSSDQTIMIWSADTGAATRSLKGHIGDVKSLAFSPDGRFLASGSWDHAVKIWSVATGLLQRTLEGHAGWVGCVAYSPDGQLVASASDDQTVKIWSVATGAELRSLTGHFGWVNSVAFSPDGQFIATGSSDNTVKIWAVANGSLLRTLTGHGGEVKCVAFSPDGRFLASGGSDNTVKIWRAF